jgi:murein DD-endopeptidase MepM/ murein hydrolase activator NlpD
MRRHLPASCRFAALLILVAVSACQNSQGMEPYPMRSDEAGEDWIANAARATMESMGAFQATSTPVIAAEPTIPAPDSTQTEPASAITPLKQGPEPLRFTFPSAQPPPNLAWRPPLYPTPWAPTQSDHFYFGRPIAADQVNWPLADYRYGGIFFEDEVHTGVDIPAALGADVLAAGPGRVTWAGYGLYYLKENLDDPYGLAVAIKHDFGHEGMTIFTVYGHMQEIFVTTGQHVEGGDLVGLVGETGNTTGAHLHLEVRVGKNNFFGSRNPELWLSPPQGWGILAGRVMDKFGGLLLHQSIQVRSLDTGQRWEVKTYGSGVTNEDPYYRENVVMGDLPAGKYEIWISYMGSTYDLELEIQPGLVSYFTFRGEKGFESELPPLPGSEFAPEEVAGPGERAD